MFKNINVWTQSAFTKLFIISFTELYSKNQFSLKSLTRSIIIIYRFTATLLLQTFWNKVLRICSFTTCRSLDLDVEFLIVNIELKTYWIKIKKDSLLGFLSERANQDKERVNIIFDVHISSQILCTNAISVKPTNKLFVVSTRVRMAEQLKTFFCTQFLLPLNSVVSLFC